jgi:hypothetical protein
MKDNKELLEKVVIALLCENEQLKQELDKTKKSEDSWYRMYLDKNKELKALKAIQPEEGSDANPHIK